MAGDCFLIGLAPVLVHMSKGPDGKFPFHPVSINLLVEVAKTLFATIILIIYVSPFSWGPTSLPPCTQILLVRIDKPVACSNSSSRAVVACCREEAG